LSLPFRFSDKNFERTSDLVHAQFKPRPYHSPSFDYLNDARWRVQILELLVMRFILTCAHIFPLRSNISSQHRLLERPQYMSLHPHKPMRNR
jgi:hypothetical protein